MKKLLGLLAVICLAILAVNTNGQASDINSEIKKQLHDKGFEKVKKVESKTDTITVIDKKGQPLESEPRKTLVFDRKFDSSSEINREYGDILQEIYKEKTDFKNKTKAEYLKVNIYRGYELVAFVVINERNERTFKIIDTAHITNLGMGMKLPPYEVEAQKKLIEQVEKEEAGQ